MFSWLPLEIAEAGKILHVKSLDELIMNNDLHSKSIACSIYLLTWVGQMLFSYVIVVALCLYPALFHWGVACDIFTQLNN